MVFNRLKHIRLDQIDSQKIKSNAIIQHSKDDKANRIRILQICKSNNT